MIYLPFWSSVNMADPKILIAIFSGIWMDNKVMIDKKRIKIANQNLAIA